MATADTIYIVDDFLKNDGKQRYLWRPVDRDGEVVDVFLQTSRDGAAVKRFFRRLLKNHDGKPRMVVTDRLRSYSVAHRDVIPRNRPCT
jgi:putative transposase